MPDYAEIAELLRLYGNGDRAAKLRADELTREAVIFDRDAPAKILALL